MSTVLISIIVVVALLVTSPLWLPRLQKWLGTIVGGND